MEGKGSRWSSQTLPREHSSAIGHNTIIGALYMPPKSFQGVQIGQGKLASRHAVGALTQNGVFWRYRHALEESAGLKCPREQGGGAPAQRHVRRKTDGALCHWLMSSQMTTPLPRRTRHSKPPSHLFKMIQKSRTYKASSCQLAVNALGAAQAAAAVETRRRPRQPWPAGCRPGAGVWWG